MNYSQLVPSAIRQSLIADFRATPVEFQTSQSPIDQLATSTPITEPLPTPLVAAKVVELSWTHLIEIIRLEDQWKRAFYGNGCLKGMKCAAQFNFQEIARMITRT